MSCVYIKESVLNRVSGSTINGKDVDGDGIPDIPLRYDIDNSNVMVQFPIGFCPGSKEGIKLNCTGNYGIVLKEWETITRVSMICMYNYTHYAKQVAFLGNFILTFCKGI